MNDVCKAKKVCCTKINNFSVVKEGEEIIKDVNIHLHCSELTAIVGPNGAGKSTLLKAMLSDIQHTGELVFESHNNHFVKKPIIGYVPQILEYDKDYPMTVSEFIASTNEKKPVFFGTSYNIDTKIDKVLKLVEASELKNKKIGSLSGGELQRVILALSISPMPDILLLDEPVSGIDQNGLKMFYNIVSKLRKEYDITILLISHDFNMVKKYADKVILLNHKVLKQGKPEEVFNSKEYNELF